MKYLTFLVLSLLLIGTACSPTNPSLPTEIGTFAPVTATQLLIPASAQPTAIEPITPEAPVSVIVGTNPPPVTLPAPQISSQPAASPQYRSGEPISLNTIHMFDSVSGWAISGSAVLTTSDGAQTWREVTPPHSQPAGVQVQAQGAFLDRLTAWIIFSFDNLVPPDAVVWHTTDGGQTWIPSAPLQHEAFGDYIWAEFSALDTTQVWLMMRGVYLGAGTHYVTQFFRTTDAGLTWLPLIDDVGVNYTGLVYADSNHGLLTWQTTGAYAPSPPEYAITLDGGVNWESRQLPPPPDAPDIFATTSYCEPYQPHIFSDATIRLLVGCFDFEYSSPQTFNSYLYASNDFGSTWTSVLLPDPVQASGSTLIFLDRNNALLLGRDIYRTVDGGQNWTYVKSVNWDGQFTFINAQNGWAIASANDESALVKTSDGGSSWSIIQPVTIE